MNTQQLYNQAQQLSPTEKRELIVQLQADLEQYNLEIETPWNEEEIDQGIQEAWVIEAERRYEAYQDGHIKAISVDEAFREVYDRLKPYAEIS